MIRVAILGARGIGAVHARVLEELGCEIAGIAGSSRPSARAAAEALRSQLGIAPRSFGDAEECLEAVRPDAVVIATPPALHRAHLGLCFERELPVLCEKPLHWPERDVAAELARFLRWFAGLESARVLLELPNVYLLEAVESRMTDPEGDLAFEFHTHGRATGEGIAADLLPHAWSLLRFLDPAPAPIGDLCVCSEPRRWCCAFRHGARGVRFDLRSDPARPKHLAFSVGAQDFTRIQEGTGRGYRVFLDNAAIGRLAVDDPFVTRARRFLGLLASPAREWAAARREALDNLASTKALLLDVPRRPLEVRGEVPCPRA